MCHLEDNKDMLPLQQHQSSLGWVGGGCRQSDITLFANYMGMLLFQSLK